MDFHQLVCAFILRMSGLGFLIGRLCQLLTELSAHHTIVAGLPGYYGFIYLLSIIDFIFLISPQNVYCCVHENPLAVATPRQ